MYNDDDEHWTVWAACRGADPELFYPVSAAGPAVVEVAKAKAICARCLARPDCLAWALRAGEPDGIWGGTTPDERRYLRREVGATR
ncbi:MAG: WhiB family transcriptional regulator, redox-sensing transcriptional regulator [Streptosporangiaceae bacterium]|nr:whiB3 [Streptosporangiaceae bacterium]MDX6433947.1 WhiB family transcriptional regulator, redox-sensing transcriptional regulator [Streptosporangiaceae bacterium]